MTTRYAARRAGFTMVELLVVIAIIAILAGLLLAAFGPARRAVKNTQAASEITQVGNAITGGYKAKMNVGHIPAFGGNPGDGKFRLRAQYFDPPGPGQVGWNSPEAIYLKQVFPQLKLNATGLPDKDLDPNQTLTFFLTGGTVTNFTGFSTNRVQPFTASTGTDNRLGPFIDITPSKFITGANGMAVYVDPWGTPYAYFSFDPAVNTYPSNTATPGQFAGPKTGDTHPAEAGQLLVPNAPANTGLFAFRQGGKFVNMKSYQLVSAGPNQQFGFVALNTDWVPGTGDFVSNGVGADDLSNFNAGPMGQQNQ